jgi:hypothetical protein
MTNPDTIASEIIERVWSIPGMSDVLPNGLTYHSETMGNREKAVNSMQEDSALVTWDGMIPSTDEAGGVYQHDFRIYVRVTTISFGSFLALFHNGVPAAGEGLPMIYSNIPSVAERIEVGSAIPVVGDDQVDYLEIYITIMDRQG